MTDVAWESRQAAFNAFDNGVYNILKLALAYDMTPDLFREVERDIRTTISPEALYEMKRYTDTIEVFVSGRQWKVGWWWQVKRVYKHITAEITFNPYRSRLSAWTDPTAPDGVRLFQ